MNHPEVGPRGSWKRRFRSLVEILLALGIATDQLALLILSPLGVAADPLRSVIALAGVTTLSSCLLLALLGVLLRLRGEAPMPFLLGAPKSLRRDRYSAHRLQGVSASHSCCLHVSCDLIKSDGIAPREQ